MTFLWLMWWAQMCCHCCWQSPYYMLQMWWCHSQSTNPCIKSGSLLGYPKHLGERRLKRHTHTLTSPNASRHITPSMLHEQKQAEILFFPYFQRPLKWLQHFFFTQATHDINDQLSVCKLWLLVFPFEPGSYLSLISIENWQTIPPFALMLKIAFGVADHVIIAWQVRERAWFSKAHTPLIHCASVRLITVLYQEQHVR